MSTESRRDSRGLILSAARQEFGLRGYAGGRVDRIARRAGVNKQLIFYYFGSKAGLFGAIVESASRDVAAATGAGDEPGGPLEQLRVVAERVLGAPLANADLVRATVALSGPEHGPRTSLAEPLARLAETIRSLVSDAQGLGYVRDDVDPEFVAHVVLATAVGSVVLDGASPQDLPRAVTDLLLRALAW